ncbi:DUF2975 domain-containing protein [Flavobacterium sp.]|uniref:DUF2975 domain-containing protein n=1 Tax=Flavobacterium sp. TaxID=239 RepID=UPI0025C4A526|nr:DUF2975 domain-containing protein [Flavobacterium sp.]MBA4154536.1 hypothetical protein [Flavobacterium sp.]
MEIKVSTKHILKVLYVISWILFIGVCIEAGGIIFNSLFTLLYDPIGAQHFWQQIDLSSLYNYNPGYFLVETLLMSIVAVLKAILLYLLVKILHEDKLNMLQPFNKDLGRLIFNLSYLSFGIGLFCYWGVKYSAWFVEQGVIMPDIHQLSIGGADVWLFMSVVLYVVAQIFKRGIEIQEENELTV